MDKSLLAHWGHKDEQTVGTISQNQSLCIIPNITPWCLWVLTASLTQLHLQCAVIYSSSLTSEMKVAQVVCNDLLDSLLCTEFDSTWEEDVSFPSRDNCMFSMRYFYIRYTNNTWKHHRLLTVRQTQVTHRGTFQCCIWGTT